MSLNLDLMIMKVIWSYTQCTSFSPTHLNALLQPITRQHPFKLLVRDYLLMPVGKGGYHTIGLYLDTFSQHVWAFKYKIAGTARTTVDALSMISKNFVAPEVFMMDSGSHFNNVAVWEFCEANTCKHHITLAYSPWVNRLVEGMNKILLHVLKCTCAPEIGKQDDDRSWENLPQAWPDHLNATVAALNRCILPALKFTPKELLLRMMINSPRTMAEVAGREVPTEMEAVVYMAYMAQQHIDGYEAIVKHTISWKNAFDRCVRKSSGEVVFHVGQLVQVYCSDLDYIFKME